MPDANPSRFVAFDPAMVVAGALVLASGAVSAQTTEPELPPLPPGATAVDEAAHAARRSVRAMAVWLARGVDSWFGDRPFEEGGRVSDGRLGISLLKREGESPDLDVRFNARFRLPNVEDNTYVFFGRDDAREVLTDQPGGLTRLEQLQAQSNAERQFFAGVGRTINDETDFRLGLRGGLKLYAQVRYRKQWQLGDEGLAEFRETAFWSSSDRFGSTTAFSYEHLFSPIWAARWLSSATITQKSERFEWSSLLGGYRSFGQQRLLGMEALVNGVQGSGVPATDYGVQVRWEQPVYSDWLLGGVVVGHFWPRPDSTALRQAAWALGISMKMRF